MSNSEINEKIYTGELFKCKICKGTGIVIKKENTVPKVNCRDCDGTGYVDWIENITGKREIDLLSPEWHDKIIEEFSRQMAMDIDKQIIEGLTKDA